SRQRSAVIGDFLRESRIRDWFGPGRRGFESSLLDYPSFVLVQCAYSCLPRTRSADRAYAVSNIFTRNCDFGASSPEAKRTSSDAAMLIKPIDYFLVAWFVLAAASTLYLAWDQFRHNPEPLVMKWGFILVTLYMGPFGLLLYVLADKEPRPGEHEQFIAPLWKQG